MILLLKQDADSPDRARIKNLKTKAISKELSTATEFPVFPIRHERQQGLEGLQAARYLEGLANWNGFLSHGASRLTAQVVKAAKTPSI